jgi:hypothetical protein
MHFGPPRDTSSYRPLSGHDRLLSWRPHATLKLTTGSLLGLRKGENLA